MGETQGSVKTQDVGTSFCNYSPNIFVKLMY